MMPPMPGMTPPSPMPMQGPPGGLPGGAPQGMSSSGMGGPMGGMTPQGGLAASMVNGMNQAGGDMDLFQRVASMATNNPMWVLLFAGMGLREALEKSGKYESKPHRSNEELSQGGHAPGPGGPGGNSSGGQGAPPSAPPMGSPMGQMGGM